MLDDMEESKDGRVDETLASSSEQINENSGRYMPFDLDMLYEHNLKIFGDVFESLIGAVFMDS